MCRVRTHAFPVVYGLSYGSPCFRVFEMVFFGWYGVSEADGRAFWELAFEGMPFNAIRAISQKILANAYAQGMGRHTEEEVFNLGGGDIRAISNFLGEWLKI